MKPARAKRSASWRISIRTNPLPTRRSPSRRSVTTTKVSPTRKCFCKRSAGYGWRAWIFAREKLPARSPAAENLAADVFVRTAELLAHAQCRGCGTSHGRSESRRPGNRPLVSCPRPGNERPAWRENRSPIRGHAGSSSPTLTAMTTASARPWPSARRRTWNLSFRKSSGESQRCYNRDRSPQFRGLPARISKDQRHAMHDHPRRAPWMLRRRFKGSRRRSGLRIFQSAAHRPSGGRTRARHPGEDRRDFQRTASSHRRRKARPGDGACSWRVRRHSQGALQYCLRQHRPRVRASRARRNASSLDPFRICPHSSWRDRRLSRRASLEAKIHSGNAPGGWANRSPSRHSPARTDCANVVSPYPEAPGDRIGRGAPFGRDVPSPVLCSHVGRLFPEKAQWKNLLHLPNTPPETTRILRQLMDIESLGGEVEVMTAEASDRDAMHRVLTTALAKFGAIHGVVHAAGIVRAGIVQAKSRDPAENVLAPKVAGTWILHDLLAETNLDFLILFSSITAVTTPFAESDYSGANAFLDAFAHYSRTQRPYPVISINWPGWKETGQLVKLKAAPGTEHWKEAALTKAIMTREGLDVFDRALASGLPQVVVSPTDLAREIREAEMPPTLGARNPARKCRSLHSPRRPINLNRCCGRTSFRTAWSRCGSKSSASIRSASTTAFSISAATPCSSSRFTGNSPAGSTARFPYWRFSKIRRRARLRLIFPPPSLHRQARTKPNFAPSASDRRSPRGVLIARERWIHRSASLLARSRLLPRARQCLPLSL